MNLKTDIHRAWLREIRMNRSMSLSDLALKVGSKAAYIAEIEHGRRNPSYKLAMRLADELNFDMKLLFVDALKRQARGNERNAQAQ